MSEESEAYRSQLIIYGDEPLELSAEIARRAVFRRGPAPAVPQRPGEVTDATDAVLASLCARAVLPVVASLLTGEELQRLHLAWGAPPYERDVWVCLVAGGEAFEDLLHSPDRDGGDDLDARLSPRYWQITCRTGCVRRHSPGVSCAPSNTSCRRRSQ